MAFGAGLTRGAQLLTHRSIEALRPAEAPYRVPDQRCKGLAVRVAPSGVKTWDLAYRIRGTAKMRRLSLGRTTDVSLERARERANELTSAARGGRDLLAEEDEAREAATSRITVGGLDVEGLLGFSGRRQDQRLAGFSRKRFRLVDERCRQQASCPNQKASTIKHGCSPSFAHASESKDLLLPAWATSSFTTVAGQGWLAGRKALS